MLETNFIKKKITGFIIFLAIKEYDSMFHNDQEHSRSSKPRVSKWIHNGAVSGAADFLVPTNPGSHMISCLTQPHRPLRTAGFHLYLHFQQTYFIRRNLQSQPNTIFEQLRIKDLARGNSIHLVIVVLEPMTFWSLFQYFNHDT